MLVLILALATTRVLERPMEFPISRGIWIYVGITTAFYLAIRFIPINSSNEQIIYYPDHLAWFYILAVSGPVLLDLLHRTGHWRQGILVTMTALTCVVTTAWTLHYYRADTNTETYMRGYMLSAQLEDQNEQYRYRTTDNICTLIGNVAGFGCFSSTIENASRHFDEMMNIHSSNSTERRWGINGLPQLLGAKYNITGDGSASNLVASYTWEDTTWYVQEETAFPIGFALDHYLFANEFMQLPQEQRALALMHAVVIYPQDESCVDAAMEHIDKDAISFDDNIDDLIQLAEGNAVYDFDRSSHGFTCRTNYDRDRVVYFTVPNDDGWIATIDGVPAEIVDSGGMMLLNVPAGEHQVIFTYETVGLKVGAAISAGAWILWMMSVVLTWRRAAHDERVGQQVSE